MALLMVTGGAFRFETNRFVGDVAFAVVETTAVIIDRLDELFA